MVVSVGSVRVLAPLSSVLSSTVSAYSEASAHSASVGRCVGKKLSSHTVLLRPNLARHTAAVPRGGAGGATGW